MLAQKMDFFAKRHRRPPVTAGSVYRRISSPDTVETAHVLSIAEDVLGISHVRFHMSIRQGHVDFVNEARILNLETFASLYHERVEA